MSDFLAKLAAQAIGDFSPSVLPRLPSRFEPDGVSATSSALFAPRPRAAGASGEEQDASGPRQESLNAGLDLQGTEASLEQRRGSRKRAEPVLGGEPMEQKPASPEPPGLIPLETSRSGERLAARVVRLEETGAIRQPGIEPKSTGLPLFAENPREEGGVVSLSPHDPPPEMRRPPSLTTHPAKGTVSSDPARDDSKLRKALGGKGLIKVQPAPADAGDQERPAESQGDSRRAGKFRVAPLVRRREASEALARPWDQKGPAEPPAIRVTIGRIDVRAVTSPPAQPTPRPARAPRRSPLSLDEYLQQRNAGTR